MVELAIVLAIIAILTMLAAPSLTQSIESQRTKSTATELYVALIRARSEALRLNQNVVLSPKDADNWGQGWQILHPVTEALIEDHEAVPNLTITGPASVTYRNSGRVLGAASVFTITGSYPASTRYVCLDLSGQPSTGTTPTC